MNTHLKMFRLVWTIWPRKKRPVLSAYEGPESSGIRMGSWGRDSVERAGVAVSGKRITTALFQAKSSSLSKPVTNVKPVKVVSRKEMGPLRPRQTAGCCWVSPGSIPVALRGDQQQDFGPDPPHHPRVPTHGQGPKCQPCPRGHLRAAPAPSTWLSDTAVQTGHVLSVVHVGKKRIRPQTLGLGTPSGAGAHVPGGGQSLLREERQGQAQALLKLSIVKDGLFCFFPVSQNCIL